MACESIPTCAVTGNSARRDQHPGLPIAPQKIATATIEASRVDAAMVHLKARDPGTKKGAMELR
jgi:uncharacterized protein (DUF849 family)